MIKSSTPAESELEIALPARHPVKIHTKRLRIPHLRIFLAAIASH